MYGAHKALNLLLDTAHIKIIFLVPKITKVLPTVDIEEMQ